MTAILAMGKLEFSLQIQFLTFSILDTHFSDFFFKIILIYNECYLPYVLRFSGSRDWQPRDLTSET